MWVGTDVIPVNTTINYVSFLKISLVHSSACPLSSLLLPCLQSFQPATLNPSSPCMLPHIHHKPPGECI